MSKIIKIICLSLLGLASCSSNNKLKVNEEQAKKELLREVKQREMQRLEREQEAKAFADSLAKLPKGIKLQENRTVDSQNPPIILDIVEARSRIKPIKYSQLGKSIRYVHFSHPYDSDFMERLKVQLYKQRIIVKSKGGISLFDENGRFLETVCRDGETYIGKGNVFYPSSKLLNNYTGTVGEPMVMGDKLYYKFVDIPNKEGWLMSCDMFDNRPVLELNSEENRGQIVPKGQRVSKMPSKVEWFLNIKPLDNYHWTINDDKWKSSKKGQFLTIFSLRGDTVCNLKDHDPVKNFTASVYRLPEDNNTYRYGGYLYIRQSFNDTIFRLDQVNKAKPMYVFNLGDKKIPSSTQGLSSKYSLEDKFVVQEIRETQNFLFIMYTSDYPCPSTAKKGTLSYNMFVLDKGTKETYHAYIDEKPEYKHREMLATYDLSKVYQKGIVNDLDYGNASWKFQQSEYGRLYRLFTAKEMKEYLKTQPQKKQTENKEFLEQIAEHSPDDELYLEIIEQ